MNVLPLTSKVKHLGTQDSIFFGFFSPRLPFLLGFLLFGKEILFFGFSICLLLAFASTFDFEIDVYCQDWLVILGIVLFDFIVNVLKMHKDLEGVTLKRVAEVLDKLSFVAFNAFEELVNIWANVLGVSIDAEDAFWSLEEFDHVGDSFLSFQFVLSNFVICLLHQDLGDYSSREHVLFDFVHKME